MRRRQATQKKREGRTQRSLTRELRRTKGRRLRVIQIRRGRRKGKRAGGRARWRETTMMQMWRWERRERRR